LIFEELQRYAACVAVHPAHPLGRARKVAPEQIVQERLLSLTLADYPDYHAAILRFFATLNRTPRVAEEYDSVTSLIAAVEAGRGVALVSQSLRCLSGPRLKIRPLHPPPPKAVVGIAYRRRNNSTATSNFIAAAIRTKSAD
jgi:DNA-binding transcriptional LysR family regulator